MMISFPENSSITVAFNGVLKEDREISRTRETLIMNVEKCNVGQAYDEETGVFTAPVTGTYFFLARALKAKGPEFCGLIITVDGSEASRSKSHDGELQAGVGCAVHLVQRLTQGQKVRLEAGGDTTLRRLYTCFSGVLVRPDIGNV